MSPLFLIISFAFVSSFFGATNCANVTFPNKTFCLDTIVGVDSSSFEFKWKLVGLQKYYLTAIKFYPSVKFQTTLEGIFQLISSPQVYDYTSKPTNVQMEAKFGIGKYQSASMEVDLFPSSAISEGADLEAILNVSTKNGSATFTATPSYPSAAMFRWEFEGENGHRLRRLLELPLQTSNYNEELLRNPEDHPVTFHFKFIRYSLNEGEFKSKFNYTTCG